jgi:hypothetical protein
MAQHREIRAGKAQVIAFEATDLFRSLEFAVFETAKTSRTDVNGTMPARSHSKNKAGNLSVAERACDAPLTI